MPGLGSNETFILSKLPTDPVSVEAMTHPNPRPPHRRFANDFKRPVSGCTITSSSSVFDLCLIRGLRSYPD
jgi:hypothetical protein